MAREIDELNDDTIADTKSEREKLRGIAPDEDEFEEIEPDDEDLDDSDDDESTF